MPKVKALIDHGRHKKGDVYYCTDSVLEGRIAAGIVEAATAKKKKSKPKNDRDSEAEG